MYKTRAIDVMPDELDYPLRQLIQWRGQSFVATTALPFDPAATGEERTFSVEQLEPPLYNRRTLERWAVLFPCADTHILLVHHRSAADQPDLSITWGLLDRLRLCLFVLTEEWLTARVLVGDGGCTKDELATVLRYLEAPAEKVDNHDLKSLVREVGIALSRLG